MRLQLRLQHRAERAARDPRRSRGTVNIQHPLKVAEIYADRAVVALAHIGLHTADHAGAATEWDRRDAGITAPFQYRHQFALAARERHKIGRMRVITAEGADQIAKRPAIRVGRPVVRGGAKCRLKRRRWRKPRCAQFQLIYSRWFSDAQAIDPETPGKGGPELLDLAEQTEVRRWVELMFTGHPINNTEDRPALHVALRRPADRPLLAYGEDVMPLVETAKLGMQLAFSNP